jgi:MtN3 and saliva related transmembrane protein
VTAAGIAPWVGAAATVVFLLELVPQPVRLWRTRSVSGLSTIGTGIFFVTELGWLAYGITSGLVVVLITAVAAVVLSGIQLTLLWRHRAPTDLWWMLLWASGLAAALVMGAIGAMLAIGLLVGLGPQAWAAWRAPSAHGVSVWRWVLSAAAGTLWFSYGALMGAYPLMATGALGCGYAAIALSRFVAAAARQWTHRETPVAG